MAPFLRHSRESGNPGPQDRNRLPWTPAFAGATRAKRRQGQAHAKARRMVVDYRIFRFDCCRGCADRIAPPATTQFDGTYGFVSATRVNETYAVKGSNRIGQCGDAARANRLRPPLTTANGQLQFGRQFEGTVSSQGELVMRSGTPSKWAAEGLERMIFGKIDGSGTVRARQIGDWCSHDFIWQKTST
jgi:hypothetical protein